jgi:hypothetical protein
VPLPHCGDIKVSVGDYEHRVVASHGVGREEGGGFVRLD